MPLVGWLKRVVQNARIIRGFRKEKEYERNMAKTKERN